MFVVSSLMTIMMSEYFNSQVQVHYYHHICIQSHDVLSKVKYKYKYKSLSLINKQCV